MCKRVDRMNNEFEECIIRIPEQYSWEYKKFKRSIHKTIYNKVRIIDSKHSLI